MNDTPDNTAPTRAEVVSVRVTAAQIEALDALAKRRGVSRSVLLREIVERALRSAGASRRG